MTLPGPDGPPEPGDGQDLDVVPPPDRQPAQEDPDVGEPR